MRSKYNDKKFIERAFKYKKIIRDDLDKHKDIMINNLKLNSGERCGIGKSLKGKKEEIVDAMVIKRSKSDLKESG